MEPTWEDIRRKVITDFVREKYPEETQGVEKFFKEENRAKPKLERDGELIRKLHHLFSDFKIQDLKKELKLEDDFDYLYVAYISRGHRFTKLDTHTYDDTTIRGNNVRVGILAALLRLVDEADYKSNRITLSHFKMYQGRLLKAPISLSHWIKHYYTQDVDFKVKEDNGNKQPIFKVRMVYPNHEFEKLLRDHVTESNDKIKAPKAPDVEKQLKRAGFISPEIRFEPKVAGNTFLPSRIEKERRSRPLDEFIEELKERRMIDEWRRLPDFSVASLTPEQVSKALRFKRQLLSIIYDWTSLESCEVLTELKIEAQETISVLLESITLDAPLEIVSNEPQIEKVTQTKKKLTLNPEFIRGGRERRYFVSINPPLTEGESLHYKIRETFANLFKTKSEINKKINNNEWLFKNPKEFVSSTVISPTDELKIKICFPKGYEFKEEECMHEVRFLNTPGVLIDEKERILPEFEYSEEGRQILKIHIPPTPQLFATYYLLWEPAD